MLTQSAVDMLALIAIAHYAQAPLPLPRAQIDAGSPYIVFAAADFCEISSLAEWSCGSKPLFVYIWRPASLKD
jgi:hypothetical protein